MWTKHVNPEGIILFWKVRKLNYTEKLPVQHAVTHLPVLLTMKFFKSRNTSHNLGMTITEQFVL